MTARTSRSLKVLIVLGAVGLGITAGTAAAQEGDERDALTLWWVVFNNPQHCATSPCDLSDLSTPPVRGSVFYASGALTDEAGRATFVAPLYDTVPGRFQQHDPEETAPIAGPGLVDARTAEIHVVVRSHGPARTDIPEAVRKQLTRFLSPTCEELGGPNECRNLQFAMHPPGPDGWLSPLFDLTDGSVVEGANSQLIRRDGVVKLILNTQVQE